MKAVIVDLNGNDAVALRDDGRFEKIKNKNYSIGQELTLQSQVIHFPKQAAVAASAAIVIAACGGVGTYTWSNPVSYVSLDINPSIAYSLNEFNRVIAVNGMNDEGVAVVDAIGNSLKNTDITTALTITVEQLSTDAYLDAENTNYMIIGVYSDKDSKADALMSTVDAFTAASVETCSITTVNVSKETKETADSYGITGGKMELINEIAHVAADPKEVDPAALADLTVAELEQTKSVAASGASISEAVAAATPDVNEPAVAEAVEPPVDAVISDSKPSEDITSASSEKMDAASEEKPSAEERPVAASDDSTAPADASAANNSGTEDMTTGSATSTDGNAVSDSNHTSDSGLSTNSTDKNGNDSSEKKDNKKDDKKEESDASSSKEETTSSDKKGESESSDKTESSSSDKKDTSSSDDSDEKDEVVEDSSQQTNCGPSAEDSLTDQPVFDDEIMVCSMAF